MIRSLVSVIQLEVWRSRWVLLISLLCGIAGLLFPAFPLGRTLGLYDSWRAASVAFAATLAVVLLVPSLATTWTSGLFSGNLTFFFARPLRGGTLWWARLFASTIVTVAALLVSLSPAIPWAANYVSSSKWFDGLEAALLLVYLVSSILLLAAILDTGLVLARRLTIWSLLGFTSVALTAGAAWLFVYWVSEVFWSSASDLLLFSLILGLFVATLFATYRQVTAGRTDSFRAQRHFVLGLSTALSAAIALPLAALWWVLHPSPSALDPALRAFDAPRASGWLVAAGDVRFRHDDFALFFVHSTTGRWFRILTGDFGYHFDPRVAFTINSEGTRAVVSDLTRGPDSRPLARVIDLKTRSQREIHLGLSKESFVQPIAVLRSGSLLANEGDRTAIFDLRDGSRTCVADSRIPASRHFANALVSENSSGAIWILKDAGGSRFGCEASREDQALLVEVDPASCEIEVTAFCAPGVLASKTLAMDADAGIGLTMTYLPGDRAPRRLRRHNLTTGATEVLTDLGDYSESYFSRDVHAEFLSDHSTLATWTEEGRARAGLFAPDGTLRGSWTLLPGVLEPIAQLASGLIVIAHRDIGAEIGRIYTFDTRSGELQPISRELAIRSGWLVRSGRLPQSIVAEDTQTRSPVVIEHDGSIRPLHLRSLP